MMIHVVIKKKDDGRVCACMCSATVLLFFLGVIATKTTRVCMRNVPSLSPMSFRLQQMPLFFFFSRILSRVVLMCLFLGLICFHCHGARCARPGNTRPKKPPPRASSALLADSKRRPASLHVRAASQAPLLPTTAPPSGEMHFCSLLVIIFFKSLRGARALRSPYFFCTHVLSSFF